MRTFMMLLTAVFLMTATPAFAEVRVAVVDMQDVLQKCEPGAAALKSLKGKFDDMKADLDKRKNEIEKMRADLEKQNMALSAEAKQEKQMAMQVKLRDFQELYQSYTQKMKTEEDKVSKPIIDTLLKVIQDFGKKNGYTAILDRKGGGLLYYEDGLDVTNQIVTEVNSAWKNRK